MSKSALRTLNIFKPGKFTSVEGKEITFSEADIAASAKAYNPDIHEAPLVIGHPKIDAPAYGWVKNLTSNKGALVAGVDQVDASFADVVNKGAYKKMSASFYMPDASNNPVPGVYYLRHVGFLGATPPAVKGLQSASFSADDADVLTVEFGEWEQKTIVRIFNKIRDWIVERDGLEKADQIIPSYEIDYLQDQATRDGMKENAGLRSSFSEPTPQPKEPPVKTQEQIAAEAELAAAQKKLKDDQASFAEKQLKALRTENATFISGLIAAAKFPAGLKDAALSFMERLDANDVVSFGEGDKAPKATELEQFKAFLNAYPASVAFGEIAGGDKTLGEADDMPSPTALADEITAHIKQKADTGVTVSFAEAAAVVRAKYEKK